MTNEFLNLLAAKLPDDERLLVVSLDGDPDEADGKQWNGRPWTNWKLREDWNNYVCISSAKADERGVFRRIAACFGRALTFMVDDVGTKVDPSAMNGLRPTMRVMTSPGNEQWWYVLSEPCLDAELFSRLSSAFIAQKLGGKDPGMAGFNRIGRFAPGVNGKRKYAGFRVEQLELAAERQYTVAELAERFGVDVPPPRDRVVVPVADDARAARVADFVELRETMRAMGMLRKQHANVSGRIPILCPWFQRHTNAAQTGTYLVEPNERNRWAGSFVCFHGGTHNNDNHLGQLREFVYNMVEFGQRASAAAANRQTITFEQIRSAKWS